MFDNSPVFVRVRHYGRRMSGIGTSGGGWFLMAPGIVLSLFALAILVWPELLAYMVASALLFTGALLIAWGWRARQTQRRRRDVANGPVSYDGSHRVEPYRFI